MLKNTLFFFFSTHVLQSVLSFPQTPSHMQAAPFHCFHYEISQELIKIK